MLATEALRLEEEQRLQEKRNSDWLSKRAEVEQEIEKLRAEIEKRDKQIEQLVQTIEKKEVAIHEVNQRMRKEVDKFRAATEVRFLDRQQRMRDFFR